MDIHDFLEDFWIPIFVLPVTFFILIMAYKVGDTERNKEYKVSCQSIGQFYSVKGVTVQSGMISGYIEGKITVFPADCYAQEK